MPLSSFFDEDNEDNLFICKHDLHHAAVFDFIPADDTGLKVTIVAHDGCDLEIMFNYDRDNDDDNALNPDILII